MLHKPFFWFPCSSPYVWLLKIGIPRAHACSISSRILHKPTTFKRLGLSDLDLSGRIHQVTCITAALSKNYTHNHNMKTHLRASSADSVSDWTRHGHVKNVDSCGALQSERYVICGLQRTQFTVVVFALYPECLESSVLSYIGFYWLLFFWRPSGTLFLLLSSSSFLLVHWHSILLVLWGLGRIFTATQAKIADEKLL